jgi:hypothetical protein
LARTALRTRTIASGPGNQRKSNELEEGCWD